MLTPFVSRQFRPAVFAGTRASLQYERQHNKLAADVAQSDRQHARHLHTVAAQNAHQHPQYLDAIPAPYL